MRLRAVLCGVCLGFVAIPFLTTHFIPCMDLPQHVSQVPLFLRALTDPHSGLTIQWSTPYSLVYVLIAACLSVFSPVDAGRIAVMVLVVAIVMGLHALAARRGRDAESAVLISALVFGPTLYWGFVSFLAGCALFLAYLVATEAGMSREGWMRSVAISALILLVYFAHVLWLGAVVLWMGAWILVSRPAPRLVSRRLLEIAPAVAVALVWFIGFRQSRFATDMPTAWVQNPMERLSPMWWVDSAFGGLRGPLEAIVLSAMALWGAFGCFQARARLRERVDMCMLAFGSVLVAGAFVLPDRFMHTILFGTRWMSFGLAFVILGLPAPDFGPVRKGVPAMGMLAMFCVATAVAWASLERTELSGLREALDALPRDQRVLGLDFVVESEILKGRPFLQTFAYAQVARDARLSFSFAEFAPSLVVYDKDWKRRWTYGLNWNASAVRDSDLKQFDYVLVGARMPGPEHMRLLRSGLVEPVTHDGVWRLDRVTRAPPVHRSR